MAFTPTAVSKSSDFNSGVGHDTTADVLSDLLDNRTESYALLTSLSTQFYGAVAPTSPSVGMLWRDSANGITKRWDGSAWQTEGGGGGIGVTQRNCILQGHIDNSGNKALFEAGSGLACKLNATTTNCVVTWMDGNDGESGQVNVVGIVSADSATFWSSLPTNNKVYLFIELSGSTVQGGYSVLAPSVQNYAPTHSAGLDWINYNTGMVKTSDGSSWTQKYRVYVGEATTNGSAVTSVTVYQYNFSTLDTHNLPWAIGLTLPLFASGDVSAQIPIPRNGQITKVHYYPSAAPSAATAVNSFLLDGNTLASTITSSATSATLTDSITLSAATNLIIDNEVVQVTAIGGTALSGTAVSGTVLTIVRAQQGTLAAAHDSGTYTGLQFATVSLSAKTPTTVTLSSALLVTAYDSVVCNVYGAGLWGVTVTVVAEAYNV